MRRTPWRREPRPEARAPGSARTGHTYRRRVLASGSTADVYDGVVAVPSRGGGLTVLVPVGTARGDDWTAGFVDGHRLTVGTGRLRQTFDLRPDAQFRALCAVAGRDCTASERELPPDGTPSQPPRD